MRLPDKENNDILVGSALKSMISKKRRILVLIIQLVILAFVFFRHYTYSYDREFNGGDLKVKEDGSRITTPEFELGIEGIYELVVGYELSSDEEGQITFELKEIQEDRYAIDSEKIPLRSYKKSSDLRIYCRNSDIAVKAYINNSEPDSNELKINGVKIEYLGKKSAMYYTLWVLFILAVVDLLLYMMFNGVPHEIGMSGRKLGFGLCAIILLSNLPMYVDYIPGGHDLDFHLLRISGIVKGLLAKEQFPVRIHSAIYNGYGYAMGVCYGDSLLYLPALMYIIGFPLRQAYKAYIFFINTVTAVGSYFCFYRISGGRRIAFTGCLVYSLSLWRLVDIYTRGALGEASAMAFLPFVVLGFWELFGNESETALYREAGKRGIVYLAFGYAGMIQVHVLSVIIVTIFSVLFCLICADRLFVKGRFVRIIAAAFLCLALSAGVLVPLADYYLTQPLLVADDNIFIQGRGVYVSQILSTYLYPFEMAKSFNSDTRMAFEMPLSIGWALLLSLFLGIYFLGTGRIEKNKKTIIKTGLLAILSLYMTLTIFPYDWIADRLPRVYKVLGAIQFPFRFFIVATVLSSTVFVLWQMEIRGKRDTDIKLALCVVCAICIWQSVDYMSKYINQADYYTINNDPEEQDIFSPDIREYLLEGTDPGFARKNETVEAEGGLEVLGVEKGDLNYDITVNNPGTETGWLEVPVFAYKGFVALSDEGKLNITYGKSSRIRAEVPAGYCGKVRIRFEEPFYWRIAEAVSLLSWLGLLAYCILSLRQKDREAVYVGN
ncbi:MAG: hypothetical protein IIZ75_04200 [Lachnospiraceae bacterium]|nr:hypothetical protein [Lachnospiraceae bacterium]